MNGGEIRVAQVLAGAEHGGAENFFTRLVAGLGGHESLLQRAYVRDHKQRISTLCAAGVEAEVFRFGGPLDLYGAWRYRKALRRFHPHVVMTWMGRATRATPRGDYVLVSRLGHYYNLEYYRHADYWVAISRGIFDHLVRGGMPRERVFYIPNFADETPVQALSRSVFDTPDGAPLVLAAGRLHVNKGFDVLLSALTEMRDVYLWLAGSGPEEARLKAQCARLGLDGRVRFLGWRSDVTALMRTVDLFVCPSRHEGLGSIVLESWAHDCPIVATASQGPAELIEDGVTGLVTPVDDAPALAAAMRRVLSEDDLRTGLVETAASHYREQFSRAHILSEYADLYARLANGPGQA
ncbi:MAG: glycosyltransferase [Thiohalobacteraceae bacterium]